MNKNIKRIISMTLILTAFTIMSPIKGLKFTNSNLAYASSNSDDEDEQEAIENSYLDNLGISEGDISFSEKKTDYTVKLDSDVESIVVTATAKESTDKIKIAGDDVSLDGNSKATKTVSLDKGRNLIKIKVYTDDYDGVRTYNLVVNRGSASTTTSKSTDNVYLDNIILSDGDISFIKDKMSYNVNVDSSINEMRIAAQPEDDNYEVKIGGIKVDKDESYRRTVQLVNGKNTILVELQDDAGNEQTYTLNIYRGGTTAVDTSEVIDITQDPIYLDDIVIEDGSVPIKFKPKVTSYAVDVKEDWDYIVIKAPPEYDDVVRINGSTCDKGTYRKKVDLKKGKNVIEITVNNSSTYDKSDAEYEERTYTITVYRGTSEGTAQSSKTQATTNNNISNSATQNTNNSSNANASNSVTTNKSNQWVNNNGKWQYNDSTETPLKNMWFYDRTLGKWYYLGADGVMAADCWIQTGGKYYYLGTDGAMAANTTIGVYKLGADGAWIG